MEEEIRELIKHNSAVLVAIFLFALKIVGLSFNFAVFGSLGHNYADHAQLEDFLISAFKSPFALAYICSVIAITLLLVFVYNWISARFFRQNQKINSMHWAPFLFAFITLTVAIPANVGALVINETPKTIRPILF